MQAFSGAPELQYVSLHASLLSTLPFEK